MTDRSDSRSREQILAEVSAGTASRAKPPHPGHLQTRQIDSPRDAFIERFAESGGEVAFPDPNRPAAEWLAEFVRDLGPVKQRGGARGGEGSPGGTRVAEPPSARVAVALDVPDSLRPALPSAPPGEASFGVCVAAAAVAETGTLVLSPSGGRATQLLPPVLLVWVSADRIAGSLEEALLDMAGSGPRLPAAVGLHSGPSKSADIGRTVVTGVHGPGRCIALIHRGDRQ